MLYSFVIFKYAFIDHDQANKSVWKYIGLNERKGNNLEQLSGTIILKIMCQRQKSIFQNEYEHLYQRY